MPSSIYTYFKEHEPQLFRFWETLSAIERERLVQQLERIPLDTLERQKLLLKNDQLPPSSKPLEPFDAFSFSGNPMHRLKGEELIVQGRLGCLLLAGGQGTRLGHPGPKGTFPLSVIKNKSLFQLCAEKVKAAGKRAGVPLQLAVMTSPENDVETRKFFQSHHFFGLEPSQISFFIQKTLPLLDSSGRLFLQSANKIAEGSDGNGHSLLQFVHSGIFDQWTQKGVEYIQIILIDNPLADPFDAELLGLHYTQENEITLKCTEKIRPDENVGVLVQEDNRCSVVEYSEMLLKEKEARREDGRLKHCCANLSLFCLSLSFIRKIIDNNETLPLHKAWKAAPFLDETGATSFPKEPNAWKFETFIFDWLKHANKVGALIYPREQCFAPLKNAEGADSPNNVRAALQEADRRVIEKITGLEAPPPPFEISADFYYPTPALIKEWSGKRMESSYVSG